MNKLQATQVMIAFHLEGDRESDLVALLKALCWIALSLWGFWQKVSRLQREAMALVEDCQQAAGFTVKVMAIGLTALAFGVGVRL